MTAIALPKFASQVAGKTEIVVPFTAHILKPTAAVECANYLQLSSVNPELFAVLPHCCFVVKDGIATEIGAAKCRHCYLDVEQIKTLLTAVAPEGHFLLLQDLTSGMTRPRILDLKIGTRTWGDDKTEEKKREMEKKDALTTTSSLGIRVSGSRMQVGENLEVVTKSNRKEFSDEEFVQHLVKFFGEPVSAEQIEIAIDGVQKIQSALNNSIDYRFIGASILLIVEEEPKNVWIKMATAKLIDLAHTVIPTKADQKYFGQDKGALKGVDVLLDILYKMKEKKTSAV